MQHTSTTPTNREQEIIQLLALDQSLSEVAGKLYVTYETVQFHVKNLKHKYAAKTLHGLVAKVAQQTSVA